LIRQTSTPHAHLLPPAGFHRRTTHRSPCDSGNGREHPREGARRRDRRHHGSAAAAPAKAVGFALTERPRTRACVTPRRPSSTGSVQGVPIANRRRPSQRRLRAHSKEQPLAGRPGRPRIQLPSYFAATCSRVPPKDGLRRRERRHLGQKLSAERLSFVGEQPSLGIGEPKTLGLEPGPQHTILGAQVLDRLALPATDPAGYQQNEELKRSGGCHGRRTIPSPIAGRHTDEDRARSTSGTLRGDHFSRWPSDHCRSQPQSMFKSAATEQQVSLATNALA
jgi:hypothetical protein